jgi:hypothetical protein
VPSSREAFGEPSTVKLGSAPDLIAESRDDETEPVP